MTLALKANNKLSTLTPLLAQSQPPSPRAAAAEGAHQHTRSPPGHLGQRHRIGSPFPSQKLTRLWLTTASTLGASWVAACAHSPGLFRRKRQRCRQVFAVNRFNHISAGARGGSCVRVRGGSADVNFMSSWRRGCYRCGHRAAAASAVAAPCGLRCPTATPAGHAAVLQPARPTAITKMDYLQLKFDKSTIVAACTVLKTKLLSYFSFCS